MEHILIKKIIWVSINFFVFLFTSFVLIESKLSKKDTILSMTLLLFGVIAMQVGLYVYLQNEMLLVTLIPITAYLPVIIGIHVISKAGFIQTMAIWSTGLFSHYTLSFLMEFITKYIGPTEGVTTLYGLFSRGIISCLLCWIVYHVIRKPFRMYVLHNQTNWLYLCLPITVIMLQFSYLKNSLVDPIVILFVYLTALSVFLIVVKYLASAKSVHLIEEEKNNMSFLLDMQRQKYEEISKKMELGRAYRHDMRHHLAILNSLAIKHQSDEIKQYINNLDAKLLEVQQEIYCENVTVNAVLSTYLAQAHKEGCIVNLHVVVPSTIPFDVLDVCTVLANALENAIQACKDYEENDQREIEFTAIFEDERKFIVSVSNYCSTPLQFDKEGLPIGTFQEGHGIGLKSVKSVIEKHQGVMQCECNHHTFKLHAILFDSQTAVQPVLIKETIRKKNVGLKPLLLLSFSCLLLCLVYFNRPKDEEPILGNALQVVNLRSIDYKWGDTELHLKVPMIVSDSNKLSSVLKNLKTAAKETSKEPEPILDSKPEIKQEAPVIIAQAPSGSLSLDSSKPENETVDVPKVEVEVPEKTPDPSIPEETPNISEGVEDMNQEMEDYIQTMRDKFLWYVARKYNGYVAMDSDYMTLRNDESLLIVRFVTTLNAGGSGEFFRYMILDKQKGEMIDLWDLFKPNSKYVDVINEEILRQMTEQVNAGLADYFIPGGIWSDDECFKTIEADQNFYINDDNLLVIVFDEYEVAPGKDGTPKFVIPAEVLKELVSHTVLTQEVDKGEKANGA